MENARRSKSDTGKHGTQNAGRENARMSNMENQNALIYLQAAYVCECMHEVYLTAVRRRRHRPHVGVAPAPFS